MENIILSPISLDELRATITEVVKNQFDNLNSQTPPPLAEYITRAQTAQILGISYPTLNDWTKRGLVPAYHVGTRVRYKLDEVHNSLNKVVIHKYGRK